MLTEGLRYPPDMPGRFSASAALWLLAIGCGGATTRNVEDDAHEPSVGQSGTPASSPLDRCDCVPVTIRWWRAGGLVGPSREASIEPCAAFEYRVLTDEPSSNKQCSSTLQGCGNALGVDDIRAALADADVQAALEQAPIVYGRDLRPLDGHVDHIEVDGKVIEVGDECNGETPDCRLPLGVDRFGRLLGNLQFQEEARATCR